ncbi:hypothetical protein [Devosia sp.]|uniref:hypothetical protein n=1 Tax=Devosia sp. TaxID=1871048 RepID=UPI0027350E29|nr:hypothetical protein [Devosia sp.]MDP2779769.1 hypothetical protein [Devosia sp.]
MITIEEARRELAHAIGEDASEITIRPMPLAVEQAICEGVTVEINIGRWRATSRLAPADLGIGGDSAEEREVWAQYLSFGEKKLLPREILTKLAGLEMSARDNLERYSYKTPWGRFVPSTAYQTWKSKNEGYRQQYLAKRDELVANFPDIRRAVIGAYRKQAHAAYDRLCKLDAQPKLSEAHFVEQFVDEIARLMRSAQEIYDSITFETKLSYIPLPSQTAADLAEADRIRGERDKQWAADHIEDAALAARRRAMDAMTADLLASFQREKREQIDTFISGVLAQLRQQVYDVALDALASIQRNDGKLIGKSAEQLRNMIATVGKLNFAGDADLDRQLRSLALQLGPCEGPRDATGVGRALQALGTGCRAVLLDLGEEPKRSGRALGIDDSVPLEVVRRQRRALGFDDSLPLAESIRTRAGGF